MEFPLKYIFIRKELKNHGCTKFTEICLIFVNFVQPWFFSYFIIKKWTLGQSDKKVNKLLIKYRTHTCSHQSVIYFSLCKLRKTLCSAYSMHWTKAGKILGIEVSIKVLFQNPTIFVVLPSDGWGKPLLCSYMTLGGVQKISLVGNCISLWNFQLKFLITWRHLSSDFC